MANQLEELQERLGRKEAAGGAEGGEQQAYDSIQEYVFSSNQPLELTDQHILDSLIQYQTSVQEEFNQIDVQYSRSNETVQDLIRTSREQVEKLKPTSQKLNTEFVQFQQDYHRFCHSHDHTSPSDGVDHPASNRLLEPIFEDLKWLKQLDRIKLWFTILSDFQDRTNKILVDQSNLKHGPSVTFDSLALEICQVITSYHDFSTHFVSPSETIHFNLFDYIYQIIQTCIHSIIQSISHDLSQTLEESIEWPKPARSPLDFSSSNTKQLVDSFKNAVNFHKILTSRPNLISFDDRGGENQNNKQIINVSNLNERSILLKAFLDPIILRFRFHFDGARPTNRLDKPEWYFNHVLDRLAEHEGFIKTDVQQLFKLSGETSIDVFYEFTTQLIKLVERKLKRSVPQILEMKPILAHTIESAIRFDSTVKQMNYLSTTARSKSSNSRQTSPQWLGTADVILSNPDWFRTWFEAEKGFADEMYLEIISSNDTWEMNEEDRRPIEMKIPGTNSSLRIQELIEQTKEKYHQLPKLIYQVEFFMNLQLPILDNYAQRINGILDGFDRNVNRFISVVGAAGDSARSKIYSGSVGLERLVKVYISSNWILKSLDSWNDDLFYAELFENLKRDKESVGKMSAQVDKLMALIESIGGLDVTLFSPLVRRFEELSSRTEAWIIRQVVQEITSELKPYLLKRWDIEPIQSDEENKTDKEIEDLEMELSEEIIRPITIWKSRIIYLTKTVKPFNKLNKIIKMIAKEVETKLISKVILDPFTIRSISLTGARQLHFDLTYGWLNFDLNFIDLNHHSVSSLNNNKKIKLDKYFVKLLDCCALLSTHDDLFTQLIHLCFSNTLNDSIDSESHQSEFKTKLNSLVKVSSLSKLEAQAVLKRRPECWKS